MKMVHEPANAWICLLAGALIQGFFLLRSLRGQGKGGMKSLWLPILPVGLGLGLARGGFELLQAEESLAAFRWCYTLGLAGLVGGTALAARLAGAGMARTLDECAAGFCLTMAFARLAQRWLGETGMGPILDAPNLFTMVNEWEEPVLSTWLI